MIKTRNYKYLGISTKLIGILLVLGACDTPEKPIKTYDITPPFDVATIRETSGILDTKKFSCKTAPKPLKDLYFESMYDEDSENSSVVDPEAYQTYKNATKSIRELETGLASISNRYVIALPSRPEIANCALTWMNAWANEDGFLGTSNHMGEFVRKWALASISLAYIQIRDEQTLDDTKRKKVETWISALAERVMTDFSQRPDISSRNNNHMYWAAWGVTTAGIALDDRKFFDWGVDNGKRGIDAIQADGTLPLELARGPKAYNYHHYAAIPLFMIANAAYKNGNDLFAENNKGLRRLGHLILSNMEDQSQFEKLTGEKQNLDRVITKSNLTWIEPYYDHYRDPEALKWLAGYRPFKHSRVGGNATLLYGLQGPTEQ